MTRDNMKYNIDNNIGGKNYEIRNYPNDNASCCRLQQ